MKKWKWYIILLSVLLIPATSFCKTQSEKEVVVPPPGISKSATYVGSETCAMCHEKIAKEFKRSEHGRIAVHSQDKEGQACETCHGPGSLHADAEGAAQKRSTIVNPGKKPEACYQCHLDKKASFGLQYHHPVPEGKIGCVDCHDPHGEDAVKPNTIRSLPGKNRVCAKCHKDQTAYFVYEHEALREGCSTCHEVHGSVNDKMVIQRDANLCLKCHFQADFPRTGNIGDRSHTTSVPAGPCWSGGCHTAVHGSNYNDHLRI